MKPQRFASFAEAEKWLAQHGVGKPLHLVVQHDDDCAKPSTGCCSCTPDFVIEELTAETWIRGARAEREWLTGKGAGRWN